MVKELLVEFAWCESYAETLSRFTQMLGTAIAFPDRYEWPEQPKILSREHFSGESRSQDERQAGPDGGGQGGPFRAWL